MFLNKTIIGLTFTHQSKVHLLSPIKNKLFILIKTIFWDLELDGLETKVITYQDLWSILSLSNHEEEKQKSLDLGLDGLIGSHSSPCW